MATLTNSLCASAVEVDLQSNGGAIKIGTLATATIVSLGNITGATGVNVNTGTAGTTYTTTNGIFTLATGTGTVTLSDDATANTVNIATGGGVKTLTIGSTNSTSSTTINSGTGALGIGTSIAKTITIGNATGATGLVLNSGTAGYINTTTNGVFTITTGTGTVSISDDATDNLINIGTGNGTKILTLGSASGSSSVTIDTGTSLTIPSFTTTGALVSDTSGVITDADASVAGYVLMSNGASVAPSFQINPSGSGITYIQGDSGSPVSGSTVNIQGPGIIYTAPLGAGTLYIYTTAINSITADSGSAVGTSNVLDIVGAGNITTSATGSTLTITGTGGIAWNNTTSSTQAMAVGNGYIDNGSGGPTQYTLPATGVVGDIVALQGATSNLWIIFQNTGQTIHFNAVSTTTGTGGAVASMNQYSSVYLICITTDTDWVVSNSTGNFIVQ